MASFGSCGQQVTMAKSLGRPIRQLVSVISVVMSCSACNLPVERLPSQAPPVPVSYRDQPACRVKSVQKLPSAFEGIIKSPASDLWVATQYDANGVNQVYTTAGSKDFTCITCAARPGAPRVDRNKFMVNWHPSGQWLTVAVEKDKHDWMWLPQSWQRGFMQTGVWLNMWIATPTGDRWYQMTDFKPQNGPSYGYTGVAFAPDGRKGVWAEIIDGNLFANAFGMWKLYMAELYVSPDGVPHLINKKDITPMGAKWVEPGNFAPDGRHILLSADIGLDDARGQDQWSLDIYSGALHNLTPNTPKVWDEHGLFSQSGKKISFMSSYPYRDEPDSYHTFSLKTEFMLMDADGGHLQQLTHFNVPGYPESQDRRTVAAVAWSIGDGSQLYAIVMGPEFISTSWMITFAGRCGAE
jgi:hypothetical protein